MEHEAKFPCIVSTDILINRYTCYYDISVVPLLASYAAILICNKQVISNKCDGRMHSHCHVNL